MNGAPGVYCPTAHWIAAKEAVQAAQTRHDDPSGPLPVLLINGGNPHPSLTRGKQAREMKREELKSWDYPRHLKGRLFSVVVHGDVEGAENVRRGLADWMRFMHMESAGAEAALDRYIGYWKP